MALKATIFKAQLNIADLDRHYYAEHNLTLARHPSETDERMMLRVLAFALYANDALQFCRGLSSEDEPSLWQQSLAGEQELWIELGLPEEKRLQRSCRRAKQTALFAYNENAFAPWWKKIQSTAAGYEALSVYLISDEDFAALGKLAERVMNLHFTIQEGEIMISTEQQQVTLVPKRIQ